MTELDDHPNGDMFIQWKGTNICMDVWTPCCNAQLHVDGYFCYALRCPDCGKTYELGTKVTMTLTEDAGLVDLAHQPSYQVLDRDDND